jgi:hypothetical protein
MNIFDSSFFEGGEFLSGDLILLFVSTVCHISSLSEKSSGDLLLDCEILDFDLTRINGDIGVLVCFGAALLVLDNGFIMKTDKVSGVGGLRPITATSGRRSYN